jgi:aminoglycoside phosphotransferase (APT) family kinase protein
MSENAWKLEEQTTPVLDRHRFDEAALDRYLNANLAGYRGPLTVRQFKSGQSNPTFRLETPNARYVLRKKPPGKLLPSAHQVDREFKAIKALYDTPVPVAKPHLLCEDASIIGTAFYIMDCVEGRILTDLKLPGLTPAERAAHFDAMNDVLAKLHMVDYQAVGLGNFGRPDNYVARQIDRWSKQYELTRTDDIPAMEALTKWLPAHIPAEQPTTIVHGDYRMGNVIYHPTEPRILAVLDWELCTLGHPLSDLGYNCLAWHIPEPPHGLGNVDLKALGLPTEAEYVASYCQRTGRKGIEDWSFYVAFSLWRLAAIAQGVYKRGLDGIASSPDALKRGDAARQYSEIGWKLVG